MEPSRIKTVLSQIESLKSIMIEVATGASRIDDKEQQYRALYWDIDETLEALQEEGLLATNPNTFPSLWDWYGYWKSNLPSYQSRRDYVQDIYKHIVEPMQRSVVRHESQSSSIESFTEDLGRRLHRNAVASTHLPPEILDSNTQFRIDHPIPAKTAFIMMRFSDSNPFREIDQAIKNLLLKHGITGVRADDKQYHDDLLDNILTYIYGCGFGIAVFDRIEAEQFNPNVALEVGYMMALRKPVCLLKDKTLDSLQADLMGKLYKPFDTYNIVDSISTQLSKWLSDWKLI